MEKTKRFYIVSLFFCVACTSLTTFATFSDEWSVSEDDDKRRVYGLWRECTEEGHEYSCKSRGKCYIVVYKFSNL